MNSRRFIRAFPPPPRRGERAGTELASPLEVVLAEICRRATAGCLHLAHRTRRGRRRRRDDAEDAPCKLLGMEVPIILAPMGTATSAEFAAGGVQREAAWRHRFAFRAAAAVKRDIETVKTLTISPSQQSHSADAGHRSVLATRWRPGVMLQVTTVGQHPSGGTWRRRDHRAGRRGRGYCGDVSTSGARPQVVDAVFADPRGRGRRHFDGRGIAAALMLGAAGSISAHVSSRPRRHLSPTGGSRSPEPGRRRD